MQIRLRDLIDSIGQRRERRCFPGSCLVPIGPTMQEHVREWQRGFSLCYTATKRPNTIVLIQKFIVNCWNSSVCIFSTSFCSFSSDISQQMNTNVMLCLVTRDKIRRQQDHLQYNIFIAVAQAWTHNLQHEKPSLTHWANWVDEKDVCGLPNGLKQSQIVGLLGFSKVFMLSFAPHPHEDYWHVLAVE